MTREEQLQDIKEILLDELNYRIECGEMSEDNSIFEMLREDYTIKQSIEIIRNNDYQYYSDIYEYVAEYFENSGIKDMPYWIDIDYKGTFENIRIESNIVYTTWDRPFIEVYY